MFNLFKKDPVKQLDKLKVKESGIVAEIDARFKFIKASKSTPWYMIEEYQDLVRGLGELQQEIKNLESKINK
jgi:hypothetical protein